MGVGYLAVVLGKDAMQSGVGEKCDHGGGVEERMRTCSPVSLQTLA